MKKRRLPVGIDSFKKLRQGYYFVDKTGFIRTLLDTHGKVTLITRPRRFGKTLAMSMLYYFFTNENAEENRHLFDGCAITRDGDEYMAEQGTRPVVFLSLKDVKERNFDLMLERFAALMQGVYTSFRYLMKGTFLYPEERDIFQSILSRRASRTDLQNSLKDLTQYLDRYHRRPVLLLIDEYDAPIQSAWDRDYYEEAISFFRNFLSTALKSNPHLDFAVMTGVLRIAKESIFSSLNNLDIASVSTGAYADVMGFSRQEVEQMATDFNCMEKLPELRKWYDGYSIAHVDIYNPWSVINYFHQGFRPALYWVNTSGNSIWAELLRHTDPKQEQELQELLEGRSIHAKIDEGTIYQDIHENRDALYTLLLTTGYLTTATPPTIRHTWMVAELRIPNHEIRCVYAAEILRRIGRMNGAPDLTRLLDALLDGRANTFTKGLAHYLETLASYYDTTNHETFYHGFLLGLFAMLVPEYTVRSNRESGYGRFDIAVFPKKNQSPGILMKFKVADSETDLPAKARDALAQIEEMDYLAEFRAQGVDEVWKYGIAFWGKKVVVVQ